MPIWAAAIGAGAGLLGGMSANRSNSAQVASANQASERSTQLQIDFQREMSNTAWQRGVKDMQAAGLNPMLAYSQGPASTPGGSSYQAQAATMQNVGSAAVAGAQQALQARNEAAKVDLTKAMTTREIASAGQLDAQRKNLENDLKTFQDRWEAIKYAKSKTHSEALSAAVSADTQKWIFDQGGPDTALTRLKAQADELKNRAEILGNQIPESVNEAAFQRSALGRAAPFVRFGLNSANQATSIIKPFTSTIDEPARGYGLR